MCIMGVSERAYRGGSIVGRAGRSLHQEVWSGFRSRSDSHGGQVLGGD